MKTCIELLEIDSTEIKNKIAICFKEKAVACIWMVHKICWAKWENGKMILPNEEKIAWQYVQMMRVFDKNQELYIEKQKNKYHCRFIQDNDKENKLSKTSSSRLWGEKVEGSSTKDGFVKLLDKKRKIQMLIPTKEDAKYYELTTQNYIGYNEIAHAGYTDYRFVKITGVGVK